MARVTVDVSGVQRKADSIAHDSVFGEFVAGEAQAGMDKYVPYRTGLLRTSGKGGVSAFAVSYSTPYARRVYYGVALNFVTPGTCALWDAEYLRNGGGEALAEAASRYLRRAG